MLLGFLSLSNFPPHPALYRRFMCQPTEVTANLCLGGTSPPQVHLTFSPPKTPLTTSFPKLSFPLLFLIWHNCTTA